MRTHENRQAVEPRLGCGGPHLVVLVPAEMSISLCYKRK